MSYQKEFQPISYSLVNCLQWDEFNPLSSECPTTKGLNRSGSMPAYRSHPVGPMLQDCLGLLVMIILNDIHAKGVHIEYCWKA